MKQKKKLREKATDSKAISKLPIEKRERLYKTLEIELPTKQKLED